MPPAAAMSRLLDEASVPAVHDAALLVAAMLVAVTGLGLDVVGARAAAGTRNGVVGKGGGLGAVALAITGELRRERVLGEGVGIVDGLRFAPAAEAAKEASSAALGAVARGVVVVRTGPEALLLAVVADEGDFYEDGEGEEEPGKFSTPRRTAGGGGRWLTRRRWRRQNRQSVGGRPCGSSAAP